MSDIQNNNPLENEESITPIDEAHNELSVAPELEAQAEDNSEPAHEETLDKVNEAPELEAKAESNDEPAHEETLDEANEAPELEAQVESNDEPAHEETLDEANESPAPEAQEEYAFQWNHTNIQDAPPVKAPRRKRVGLIFGIITSGVFLLAIIALVLAITLGTMNGSFDFNASVSTPTVDYNTQINVTDKPELDTSVEQEAPTSEIELFKHSTVVVLCDSSTGTGIILDDNGMIVTNHHVIENATVINVYLYDGRSYSAKLIGSDAYNDIAVIKIDAPNLSPATFANSDNTYTGQKVYAVGTPAGPEFAWSVTAGIVSHPNRELKFYTDDGKLERSLFLIQTDALVNPGNSGGPLVNAQCQVMGIVTMRLSDTYVGMGFAIPTNVALPIIESIIKSYKEPSKLPASTAPQLGISGIVVEKGEMFMMSDMGFKDIVTEDFYNRNPDRCKKATHAGVYVLHITEGFDAANKLQIGDIIIGADKTPVNSMDALKSAITAKKPGDTLNLTVIRNNEQIKIDVVLGTAGQ